MPEAAAIRRSKIGNMRDLGVRSPRHNVDSSNFMSGEGGCVADARSSSRQGATSAYLGILPDICWKGGDN